jgi:pimeloyl-ACP methyl ester carboxylesterase
MLCNKEYSVFDLEKAMLSLLIWFPLKLFRWALVATGALALLLTAMIATPLVRPPELHSVSEARNQVDVSNAPAVERFQARDGTWLGFRHYAPGDRVTGSGAIFIHGSSGSSGTTNHALAAALAARGVETWALDIRGHGTSGTRGDIGYVGQLEDDLADFVGLLRRTTDLPLTLVGHSAGGGFALRVAGSQIQNQFVRTVLLAPYLGYDAPTNKPHSGGWANADVPRILGLLALRKIGIECCEELSTLAFAVPPNSERTLVSAYSYRLMINFATRGYRLDLANVNRPLTIIAGADDEMMISDKYAEAVHAVLPTAEVRLIDGVNHMGVVSMPKAVKEIADYVATHGGAGA